MTHHAMLMYTDKITKIICEEHNLDIRKRKLKEIEDELRRYFNVEFWMVEQLLKIIERAMEDE